MAIYGTFPDTQSKTKDGIPIITWGCTAPYGEGTLYAKGCGCALCMKILSLIRERGMITGGGWADPRRNYLESKEEFKKRVPDGFTEWPKDHDLEGKERSKRRVAKMFG